MTKKTKKPLKNKRAVSNTKKKPLSTSVKANTLIATSTKTKKPPQNKGAVSNTKKKPLSTSTKTKKPPKKKGAVGNVNKKPPANTVKPKKQTSKRPVSVNIKKQSRNGSTPKKQGTTKKPPQNKGAVGYVNKTHSFPDKFPFWARLKIDKQRTTLIIDEENVFDKKSKKIEDSFVCREATHTYKKEYQEVDPNPSETDKTPMYLKRPSKKPKRLFRPHNKDLTMPEDLKRQYAKNTKK